MVQRAFPVITVLLTQAALLPLSSSLPRKRAVGGTGSTGSSSVGGRRQVLRLGYLTGSHTAPGEFYNKVGQLISGAITLAVNEINADHTVRLFCFVRTLNVSHRS